MANMNNQVSVEKLTDDALIAKIKNLAAIERKLTQVMIQHIAEVDRRKLYLRQAYCSLFEYLTLEIGYSAGAAQRRIDAARLLRSAPQLCEKIESGSINLSQVSYLQKACRQIKKESGSTVSSEVKQNLLSQLENKSAAMTQVIVAKTLKIDLKSNDVVRKSHQADESVRIELTFSKEQMELITQAQALLSNTTGGDLKHTLLYVIENFVHAKTKNKTKNKNKNGDGNENGNCAKADESAMSEIITKNRSPLTATVAVKTKKEILNRDQCCQFTDKHTGRVCGSKFFLEVDHIQPRFANGDHSTQNLRILCRNHNQFRYHAGL